MASDHTTLDAAAVERKARLAQLASLKRQRRPSHTEAGITSTDAAGGIEASQTNTYLTGRNYDSQARGPRLGFENAPIADVTTLEQQADFVATTATTQAAKDEEATEKGIDIFRLQPKKPNWDLKRDLDEKMKVLNVRTQNAIARLVRERIEKTKAEAKQRGRRIDTSEDQGEEVGMDGNVLVEGVHLRELEEQEDERMQQNLNEEDH